jgi:hypothetical protein
MHLIAPLLVVALLLSATARMNAQSTAPSATQPSTQPLLRKIELHTGNYLSRIDIHTTITPDGLLRSVRIDFKSWGPGDIDPQNERHEIRQGQLSATEQKELAELFVGWERWSDQRYPARPDGEETRITFGDKTVSGGESAPPQLWIVHRRIVELTATMPIVQP